ncbi:MAG TPA: hypothetical protein PLC59_04005 [Bacteroidales bacterium]|nr:hypothetical protein [Bacteroidales bacterium]HQI45198.1 hypothetical protein [Bacteroidales bacterium]
MNIPPIYLIEPYNAYAPKGRKKHWMEEVEEQALLEKIVSEQIALQEAEAKRTSNTLPPQSPNSAMQTVVGSSAGAGASGGMGSGAGAGGTPAWDFFNPTGDVVAFDISPSSGPAPLTVTFTNRTSTPQWDDYNWEFILDGKTIKSTEVNPIVTFHTGSDDPSYITASLQVTNSFTGVPGTRSLNVYIPVSVPVVNSKFTYVKSSNIAPLTVEFTNISNTNNGQPLTYRWEFEYNNGTEISTSISTLRTPSAQIVDTGSYTASLQVTGSYGIASLYTQSFVALPPTLVASFTTQSFGNGGVEDSYEEPVSMSYTSTTTYDGHGTLTYKWNFGSASFWTTEFDEVPGTETTVGPHFRADYVEAEGGYTASLEVTESNYDITSLYTQSFYVSS